MKELLKIKKYGFFWLFFWGISLSMALIARADDDEEISNQSTVANQNSAQLAQTSTVTSTKVITLSDSDGDGLLDNDDPHPKIAEIYIVADEDKNGIVDSFEK